MGPRNGGHLQEQLDAETSAEAEPAAESERPAAVVDPHEMLFVTARKRFVPVYGQGQDGARELVLHVGTQEISFDEPDLFPWAEKLIEQDSFMAATATTWSAEPLEWQ